MNTALIVIGVVFGAALLGALGMLFMVSRRSEKVMESLIGFMTRPERAKVHDAARVLHTILADEINKIESSFRSMQQTLAAQIAAAAELKNELGTHNATIVASADEAAKKISVLSQRLDNTVGALKDTVESTSWAEVENQTEKFTNRINELLGRIDTTSQKALDKTATVQNQIDGWIESGKTLSAQLKSDADKNIAGINLMGAESHNLIQKLDALAASVASGFETVKNSAANYESVMDKNDKMLGLQIEKMDTFAKTAKSLLTNQTNTLANTANVVGSQVRLAESSIEKQVHKLADAVENLMESATATEGSVRNVSTELTRLTNKFNTEIKEFAVGVVGELNTVSTVANTTLESTRGAAGAFGESVRAMATGVRETLIEMNTAHTQLSGQSENLIKMSADTTAQLQPLSELIEKYYAALPELASGSTELSGTLEKIVESLNEKIAVMKTTIDESITGIADNSGKLETLAGQSRQQMIDLMSDYAKAVNTMQTLNKQMMVARATAPMEAISAAPAKSFGRVSSADFMATAARAMDKIHEQSVDLTRSTGAEIPDAIWKKYHAGDTAVFSKWLAKILGAADKKRVRNMLKSDSVFRSQATQFVRSFDNILNAAKSADNTEKLVATMMKTDIGQIYSALKV